MTADLWPAFSLPCNALLYISDIFPEQGDTKLSIHLSRQQEQEPSLPLDERYEQELTGVLRHYPEHRLSGIFIGQQDVTSGIFIGLKGHLATFMETYNNNHSNFGW